MTTPRGNTGGRTEQARPTTPVAVITLVVLFGVMTACSDDSESESDPEPSAATVDSTTSTVPRATSTNATTTTTSEPPTLEERIVANMQGAQIEYQDVMGDNPFPIVFFHDGNWAAESFPVIEEVDRHCPRATYTWSVVDATSETDFTILYDELSEPSDCLVVPGTRFTAVFSGAQLVDGKTVYDFTYLPDPFPAEVTGTRTVCSAQWDDPEPCGLTLPGFEMPSPPED